MPGPWSQRLLTLLQLTRMALVFTAIADGWCGLLLWERARAGVNAPLTELLHPWRMLGMAVASVGLYGFGMSLNDIIDRRRDRQISPTRPIPSGRVSLMTAHLICGALAALALAGGVTVRMAGGPDLSVALVAVTLGLISFYDLAGKYLVGPGLVTLGLVRFAHACIPALEAAHPWLTGDGRPGVWHPFIWHPLWLLNHVVILSTVCYLWEEKRPSLNVRHWAWVLLSLLMIDAAVLYAVGTTGTGDFWRNTRFDLYLALPLSKSLVFVGIALYVRKKAPTSREAGQATMLYGLLWLIVYDACFAGMWVHWAAGLGIVALAPVAYGSVKVMRGWSKLVAASQRPEFRRAGT